MIREACAYYHVRFLTLIHYNSLSLYDQCLLVRWWMSKIRAELLGFVVWQLCLCGLKISEHIGSPGDTVLDAKHFDLRLFAQAVEPVVILTRIGWA